MKKSEVEIGMIVGWKSDIEVYGQVIKKKPIEAVIEVYDAETGDTEEHSVSYVRLWESN